MKRSKGEPTRQQLTTTPPALSLWMRALTGAVAALVLAGTSVIALVVVGTQVGFYRLKMGQQVVDFTPLPIPALDLPVFTPLATEGVVWMCTLMAVVLVLLNRPAGIWTRAMWAFSAIAAFVNTFHAIDNNHDLLGGIVTGGLSIAGPFTVHLFVIWVKHVRTGRTLEQVRIDTEIRWALWGQRLQTVALALLDHTVHPVTAARTISVWRTYRGLPYSQAWFIASARLRRRTQERYTNAVHGVREPCIDDEHADAEDCAGLREGPLDRCASPMQQLEARLLADLNNDDLVEHTLHTWATKVLGNRAPDTTSGNTTAHPADAHPSNGVHTPVTPPLPKRTPGRAMRAREPRTPLSSTVHTGDTKADKVIAEYWRRKRAGEPVTELNMSRLARDVLGDKSARSTVSRTWKACLAGEHPDPGGDDQ